ncbi:MAG TPA: hypothetical protein ENG29_03615 [Firmicutes bacterium]|nr:MAG: hypothetical protein DRH44_01790 [Candidatus Coatesbacteria bacterium]HDM43456.1 hypothetical protein [Bacillota bacterium]
MDKMNVLSRYGVVALLLLLIFSVRGEWGVEEYRSRLDEIKSRIEVQRKARDEIRKKEMSILEQINGMEMEAEKIENNIKEIERALIDLRGEITELETDIADLKRTLEKRKDLLGHRLRAVYKLGRQREARVLLSASDYEDLLRRIKFLLIVANEDKKLAKKIEEERQVLEAKRNQLRSKEKEVVELLNINADERLRLRDEINSKEAVLKKVRGERKVYEQMIAELESASREIEAMIRKMQGETLEPIEFRKPTGKYYSHGRVTMPTVGTIVKPFGKIKHPVYGTVTRNDGIDIAADRGSEIKALMGGRVIFSDWFRGYGKLIIIDNGSGYATLYAHCNDVFVSVGDEVYEGDVIGTVGSTGTLGEVLLHFEIRKDGNPIDPITWLKG